MCKRIKNYKSLYGVNCILTSFGNIIRMVVPCISDSDIFFKGEGFRVQFIEGKTKDEYAYYFSHEFVSVVKRYMKNNEIQYSCQGLPNNKNELIYNLKKKIDNNTPIILFISTECLNYNLTYINNTKRIHAINIIGYNEKGFLISDSFVPTKKQKCYEGILSYEVLVNYWENELKDKQESIYIDIEINTIRKDKLIMSNDDKVKVLNKNIVHYYLKNQNESYYRALNHYIKSLFEINIENKDLIEEIEFLAYQMNVEGVIPARKLLFQYLIEINEENNLFNEALLCECENFIKEWRKKLLLMIKNGIKSDKEGFDSLANSIKELTRKETIFMKKIIDEKGEYYE